MAEQEEDFSQLPLPDRFTHKQWKVRKEGYEAAAKEFEKTPDESDPVFRPFVQDSGLWKGAAGDSNVAAQQEGLGALCAFLKYGGQQGASRSRSHAIQPIFEKGLSSTRQAAKANALEALLLYIEIDKPDLVIEELLPALSNKQPKVIAATLAAFTAIYHNFGVKVVEPKSILKALPKVFGHPDKNVRAEATNLTAELYRWLKEAMKPVFWAELKPVQQTDLEKLFEKVKEEPSPKQERFTRAQQAQMAVASAIVGDEVGGEGVVVDEPEEEEAVEVDAFDLAEPVDALSKLPSDFQEMIHSTKWKERKETLDALFNVVNTPRIKNGPYDDVVHALAKCMKDANIAVVTVAANCIEKLALGMRKGFAKYRSTVMAPIMERLKEKKQSVADALGAALDAVFTSTSLTECLEETLGFLVNKNPNVKGETIKFLVRCLRMTRDVPPKVEQKSMADAATKLLTESTEAMRSGGAEILGTMMKIIGERAMGPYLDGLDDIRKNKIKEYFDTAEVKAKEKPKPVAAPPKATGASAVGKKVVARGSKRLAPAAKKPPPPIAQEEPTPSSKPTGKALPKQGVLAKPGLAQPSGLKLGGLKKPAASSPQPPHRRVISPVMGQDDDEPTAFASPSKPGMGRGFAGRPLARPTATPMSPPPAAPVAPGMSAVERAEMEELRAEKERLSALTDSLRSTNTKLTAEISELQNQNAQLIEDHTRDVLQIKAKETQLTRARGEADVLRSEMESVRKETERYKREVTRLGRESIGREREDSSRGRSATEDVLSDAGIYDDQMLPPPQQSRYVNGSKPVSTATTLHRTGSGTSVGSRTGGTKPPLARPGSTFTNSSLSPSDEKENATGFDALAARRKISPPVNGNGSGSPIRLSAERPAIGSRDMSREASDAGSGAGGDPGKPAENWKRAAEVTSQLKARIEAMKVSRYLARGHHDG
jgi:protein STU2